MFRSRSWRRQQYRRTATKRTPAAARHAADTTASREPGNHSKHTAHPADCGVATCLICHPAKNSGNSSKIATPKSIRKRELLHEMRIIKSLPIDALRENF